MKLKLLHVLPGGHLGGAEWMCLHLACAQQERGHEVYLLLLDEEGEVGPAAVRMGITVARVEPREALGPSRRAYRADRAAALQSLAKSLRPSLVHSHVPITNLLSSRALPPLGIPWIATIHGSWRQFGYAPQTVRRPWLKPYFLARHAVGDYWSTRSAAAVAAISDYVRRELLLVGVPEQKITVIHDALPALPEPLPRSEGRARLGLSADDLIIGSLGYFAPVKGFDLLIHAFARLAPRYPNARLLIAGGDVLGDPTVRHSLERLITQSPTGGRARLITPLDPKAGFLSALDIFVVASRTEGFSLALAEAMQHGLPSVVSDRTGSVEAARPGQESLAFHTGDPESLAAALEKLILDPALREALGRAASARASTYLTLPRCAEEYEQLYQRVLSAPDAKV